MTLLLGFVRDCRRLAHDQNIPSTDLHPADILFRLPSRFVPLFLDHGCFRGFIVPFHEVEYTEFVLDKKFPRLVVFFSLNKGVTN